MSKATFNIFRGNIWHSWDLRDANGRILAGNSGYKTRAAAIRDILSLKSLAPSADIFDFTKLSASKNKKQPNKRRATNKKQPLHEKV